MACRLDILFYTLVLHFKHVPLCQGCSDLDVDGVANIVLSRRYLSFRIRRMFLRILSLRLSLLTIDTNFTGMVPIGIYIPMSKFDPRLTCFILVGWALVHFTALPLRTFVVLSSMFDALNSVVH